MIYSNLAYSLLIVAGFIIGSFINVLIYRIPRNQEFIAGRSSCPQCRNRIAWYDLIPIISFVLLKGRCRNCKAGISFIYPLIELWSGAIFLLVGLFIANPFEGAGWLPWLFYSATVELMTVLLVIDARYMILPDMIILAFLILFAAYMPLAKALDAPDLLQKAISFASRPVGAAVLGGIPALAWIVSKGKAVGFGDAKLLAALGVVFGFKGTFLIFFIALFSGLVFGLYMILFKKAGTKTKVPFGSFIAGSAIVYLFFWQNIVYKFDLITLRAFT